MHQWETRLTNETPELFFESLASDILLVGLFAPSEVIHLFQDLFCVGLTQPVTLRVSLGQARTENVDPL